MPEGTEERGEEERKDKPVGAMVASNERETPARNGAAGQTSI